MKQASNKFRPLVFNLTLFCLLLMGFALSHCQTGGPEGQEKQTETSGEALENEPVQETTTGPEPAQEGSTTNETNQSEPKAEGFTQPDAGEPVAEAGPETPPASVTWSIGIQTGSSTRTVSPYLLGQYDLSGAMFGYDKKANLITQMKQAGFSEWRVSVGRWEVSTWLLPKLTDGTSCQTDLAGFPSEAFAPAGATDNTLMQLRDWFTYTDGKPVTSTMTQEDSRYNLAYLQSVLDVASAFGVKPFVSIDLTPRALAINKAPERKQTSLYAKACTKTFTNAISNSRPASNSVYGSAVVGLVQRTIEGGQGRKANPVTHWEIGNEPEFAEFWDRTYGLSKGLSGNDLNKEAMDSYFGMVLGALVQLDAYRSASQHPNAKNLKFGLGSFGYASTAETVLTTFDSTTLPNGKYVPIDFISFHAYDNDPLKIVEQVKTVTKARDQAKQYNKSEVVLAEWGPTLSGEGWSDTNMDLPLLIGTTLALSAHLGLDRAHHAIFYDFYGPNIIKFGLLDTAGNPKPLFHAYALLHKLIGQGNKLLSLDGPVEGKLENGMGAVLATEDPSGKVQVLIINRTKESRNLEFKVGGSMKQPSEILLFADPSRAPQTQTPASSFTLPPQSMALITLP